MSKEPKKTLKIPKEMPSNIIIKPETKTDERGGLAGKQAPSAGGEKGVDVNLS